ncbi:MAG: hypothetical protein WCD04_20145 [Terriglobia bacterium]|jgi:hypothetical protein
MAVYPEGGAVVPGTPVPDPEILVCAERDGTIDNLNNFLECVRSRKPPNANIHVGFEAARTSWIGNIALKRGMKVVWDASRGGELQHEVTARWSGRSPGRIERLRHGAAHAGRARAR